MADLSFRFHRGALHFPSLHLWLDAHEPIGPAETVFISHAHSDHTAPHARVLVSEPTGRLLRARLPGDRTEQVLAFGRTTPASEVGIEVPGLALTLFPAGHILGSAMLRLELGGQSLLYTGDFKLRPGRSAEPCQPAPADVLVMETTYGRPHYAFPPTDEVVRAILRFCREALDNDEVPVLLGYSLGKSQEILQGLHGAGLPVMLNEQVLKLTRVYEACGQRFPEYRSYDPARAIGHVVLAPPGQSIPALRRRLGRCRLAMLTGWALDPGARFRYQADAVFPLSDHADFPDLVELVRQVRPRRVHTLHGFAADFAAHLRQLGVDASALSEPEQLQLLLGPSPDLPPASGPQPLALAEAAPGPITPGPGEAAPDPAAPPAAEAFGRFADTCTAIASVRPKREKVLLLAGYLASVPNDRVGAVTLWFCGTPFASSANQPLRVGWSIIQASVSEAAGVTLDRFRQAYLRHGETGETVAALLREAPRPAGRPRLPVAAIAALFGELHRAVSPAARLSRLAGVLREASPDEGRFLVKILTGDLRIGLKEGLVEEAVAEAFRLPPDAVRTAHQ
ncbi:MAG: MBL fold metallo-hydrolase, partial [Verrucomicrobiota bacterium]